MSPFVARAGPHFSLAALCAGLAAANAARIPVVPGAVAAGLLLMFSGTAGEHRVAFLMAGLALAGLVIAAQAVRRALAEGATEFRLGPGDQPYKRRFATDDPGLETIGLARTPQGWASLLAARRRGGV